MGTRNKEICVLLLDVGPFMHPALAFAARAVSAFVLSKILNKPTHELALVYYGTQGTNNALQQEMAQEGDPDQYTCISVQHELDPPDANLLTSLSEVPKGTGRSDFVDALTVAVDCIYRTGKERPMLDGPAVKKRIILISNFLQQAAGDANDPFLAAIMDRLKERQILLEIISVDVPSQDAQQREAKDFNLGILKAVMAEVRHKHRSVSRAVDLLGALSPREYAHTAYYSGPFAIGNMMTIKVKVCKKTSKEKLPSLGKYSDRSEADTATHQILRETEYKSANNPDEAVTPEDKVKAYKYGKQVVPISEEEEQSLQYLPDKAFELIGFVSEEQTPARHFFMKDTWIVAPEKDNSRSQLAVSAIAQGMSRDNKRAIVRFIPRAKGAVQMGVLSPALRPDDDSSNQPDCLWMNMLPFMEDVRTATFMSFEDQQKRLPSEKQLTAMRAVVESMNLTAGDEEERCPDTTVNPLLHRFYSFIASLVVEPSTPVPDQDPLMDFTINAEVTDAKAEAALRQLAEDFPLKAGPAAIKQKRGKDDALPHASAMHEGKGASQEVKQEQDQQQPGRDQASAGKEEDAEELGPVVAAKTQLPTQENSDSEFMDMD